MNSKKISILGAGKSGKSCARLALKMGYEVILSDISNNVKFENYNKLTLELGGHSDKILESDFIVVSPGISSEISIIKKAQKLEIPIISEIEFASWFTNSNILAVTGSNGKSTTVSMIHQILSGANCDSFLGGNIGTPFSENVLLEIEKKKLAECVHVVELSSFQLERLKKFKSQISCILNISEDHLDRYVDMNDYINAKLNIINVSEKIIYNSNDSLLSKKINNIKTSHSLIEHESIYEIHDNSIFNKRTKKNILSLNQTNLIGEHNLFNALIACTVANLYGIDEKSIIEEIINFQPLAHRLEFVRCANGVNYYNDSKSTNVNSTITALNSFENNIVLILGGMNKGVDFSELSSRLKSVKKVFCYGNSGQAILKALESSINIEYIKNFKNCITSVITQSNHNDNVLLSPACASFDQFSNYQERGESFKKMVMNI